MTAKVGIIGCGTMSRFHLAGYQAAGAQVVGVADPDEAKGRALAEQAGCPWHADHRALLDVPGLQGVSVTVPNFLHRKVCTDALRRGVAVLCEKTLAADMKDAAALVRAVRSTGTPFQIGYMKRFHPAVAAFRKQVASLGALEGGHVTCYQPMGRWPQESWLFTPDKGGGGILLHGGSHTLDLLMWAVGRPPVAVTATTRTAPGALVEHQASGMLDFGDGLTVTFEAGWFPHTGSGPLGTGWDETVTLRSAKGIARLTMVDWTKAASLPATAARYTAKTDAWDVVEPKPVDYFGLELAAFARVAARRRQPGPTVEDGYVVDAVIHAAYRSAASGRRQRVARFQ